MYAVYYRPLGAVTGLNKSQDANNLLKYALHYNITERYVPLRPLTKLRTDSFSIFKSTWCPFIRLWPSIDWSLLWINMAESWNWPTTCSESLLQQINYLSNGVGTNSESQTDKQTYVKCCLCKNILWYLCRKNDYSENKYFPILFTFNRLYVLFIVWLQTGGQYHIGPELCGQGKESGVVLLIQ